MLKNTILKIKDYLNKHVESFRRATVLSLNGFFESILSIIIFPFFGYMADLYSITTVFLIEGILVLVIGLPIVFILSSPKKSSKTTIN